MKLAVAGTRTFSDKKFVYQQIKSLISSGIKITEIITGGMYYGPDKFSEDFAKENKIKFTKFEADWTDMAEPCFEKINQRGEKYNALAGFKRNTLIAEACTCLMAFWDRRSNGTQDVIQKTKDLNKKVLIVKI